MRKTFFKAVVLLCAALLAFQLAAEISVGSTPPAIQATDWINSAPLTLGGLKGRVVILEFWATWCPPCRSSIPHLITLSKNYAGKPVTFISLTDESKDKVTQFMDSDAAMRMPYPVACGSSSSSAYGVRGIPHAFVVGKDGKIVWRGHPMSSGFKPAIDRALDGTTGGGDSTTPGDGDGDGGGDD